MTTHTDNRIHHEAENLAHGTRGIINATSEAAGEVGHEVRKQIDVAVDRGREVYDRTYEKAVEGARNADVLLHEQPYKFLAIALGVGAFLGIFLTRR